MSRLTIISIVIGIFILSWLFLPPVIEEQKEMNKYCQEKEIKYGCSYSSIRCSNDCEEFGKKYFRYSDGGFSSSECWCKVNNESEQIW